MAYTSPRTWVTGEVVTAALMNAHIRDNLLALATTAGLLLHEAGGMELDISGVADGGVMRGTGAGVWAILASFLDTNGRVTHEYGGIEADISAVADGGIVRGTGAGSMGLLADFLTSGGLVKHEYGGIEADISAIAKGGLVAGSGTGTMAIEAVGSNVEALIADSTKANGLDWRPIVNRGNYTGDGATSKAITGVGFAPKFVIIYNGDTDGNVVEVFITDSDYVTQDANGMAVHITGGTIQARNNRIISLDSDGFTVDDAGVDANPNMNTEKYYYVAFG